MTDICLLFEVHQPFRVNRNFHLDLASRKRVTKTDLFDLYFDNKLNREIFNRVAEKCYIPANKIILDRIDNSKREKRRLKVSYSLSGVFIEQCERWNSDLLDSFRQLASTQCVEFLGQTYYHSLSSLYKPDWSEFVEQVGMQSQLMKSIFDMQPKTFENAECIYNNAIAKKVEEMDFKAVVTEGLEKTLGWRSPNYVYRAKNASIRVLLRNYQLSDDIGFRFSSTRWNQWPLTADKYAAWLASVPGDVVTIFLDYETFGEHHWPGSGILDFLRWLPTEVNKWDHLSWCTPQEVIQRHMPVDEIDVPEDETISWADLERNTSTWLGNHLQMISFKTLRELSATAKEVNDEELLKIWRYLQTSDHFYYICTKGGEAGTVHEYFNPYNNPLEAFTNYISVLSDLQARYQLEMEKPKFRYKRILRRLPPEKGFKFFYKIACPVGLTAHSLEEFYSILKTVNADSIKFHMSIGDFERWLLEVVGDRKLSTQIARLSKEEMDKEALRQKILERIGKRIDELKKLSANN